MTLCCEPYLPGSLPICDGTEMTNDPSHEINSPSDENLRYRHVRNASIRGAWAGFFGVVSQAILRFGSIAVLARLLTPEDFGVAAMAGILLSLVILIGDWGLTTASTQRFSLDDDQLSRLFWINSVVGLLLAAIIVLCSPLMAMIFAETRVTGAAMVLSSVAVAIGLGAQHEAVMRRRLKYETLQLVRFESHMLGVGIAITVAVLDGGYWALIGMHIGTQISRTALYWATSKWRPSHPRTRAEIRPVLKFASKLVPSMVLSYVSRNAAQILLGTLSGPSDLGLFNRATASVITPTSYLIEPLERIVPASLSRLQSDPSAFRRLFTKALNVAVFAACGFLVLVAVEAPTAVAIVLGNQWDAAIPLVRWLSLAASTWLVARVLGWILIPLGRAEQLLVVRSIRAVCSVVGVAVGWKWGPVGVAAGYSMATVVSLFCEIMYGLSGTPIRRMTILQSAWRPILSASVGAIVVVAIPNGVGLAWSIIEIGLYGLLFATVHALLPGGWQFMREVWRLGLARLLPRVEV